MRVTSNGKVRRSIAEWRTICERFVQSLIASCRLQGIDPYVYFVDVLQRIDTHPAFDVHLLTPRLWKQHFAPNPHGEHQEDTRRGLCAHQRHSNPPVLHTGAQERIAFLDAEGEPVVRGQPVPHL